MAERKITVEHLGIRTTQQDVEKFKAAVKYLAETQFDGDDQSAEDYLWGNGDYMARMPEHLLER